jgi:hypothetical protein
LGVPASEPAAMRVGKSVKPRPNRHWDYCGTQATLVHAGDDAYPYRHRQLHSVTLAANDRLEQFKGGEAYQPMQKRHA